MAALPIFVTNHAVERAAERIDVWAAAPSRVAADVREAISAGRVACTMPRSIAGTGPRPRAGSGCRFAWTLDEPQRVYVVKRKRDGVIVVTTLVGPSEVAMFLRQMRAELRSRPGWRSERPLQFARSRVGDEHGGPGRRRRRVRSSS